MKRPPPLRPAGAPPGTVWFGGHLEWFSVALTITGESLDPAEVTRILGVQPTRSYAKGDPVHRTDGPVAYRRSGHWARAQKRDDTDEWDVEEVIKAVIADFTAPEEAWSRLPSDAAARLWLGLELTGRNQGLSLEPEVAAWLARRGIRLELDIYRDAAPD